ncbi:immunoglobulin-like domain-containing protein [Cohnella sp. GCM10027633]|uniref:immunoglobulin-like domain-containing protein n=1 Tax=unclassified Cohnella TaxID=2636738 RepID=UPI0036337F76
MALAAVAGGGTKAEAVSVSVASFDYSGGNAKTFAVDDGMERVATITLETDYVDMSGLVSEINEQLAGAVSDIEAIDNGNTFMLRSRIVGKFSVIMLSGANVSDFFSGTVYRGVPTDQQIVEEVQAALTPLYGTDESQGWVTVPITLPSDMNGTTITWSSANPSVLTSAGAVTRQPNDTVVTLTAHITLNNATADQTYDITVIGTEPRVVMTDEERVANTKASLTPFYDTDETQAYVRGSVTLPTTDIINDTIITWVSQNENVISDTGYVQRQSATQNITLTATITRNSVTDTAIFILSVIGYDSEWILQQRPDIHPTYASGDYESSVTQDLQLPSAYNGVAISWSSNDSAIANDGTVRQPNFADGRPKSC